ncbi:hypothetical protein N7528_007576 [Penicillium herquei]|nr:hypothetical protein N7528_007576 [Penicillium herquei]
MSPRTNCCVICGYIIWDYGTLEDRWLAEFRVSKCNDTQILSLLPVLTMIAYSNPEGCFISGVGINKDPDEPLQASSDPTKRYDDDDYDLHLIKEFFVNFSWEETISFASHNACWELFEEASKPDDIPLKRFIEVCSSLPLTGIAGLFHWGHNYGGIYSFAKSYAFPWEYRFEDDPSDREAWRCATENPYNIPSLSKLKAKTAHEPSIPQIPSVNQPSDCFGKLPWEIREAIANQLSTHDALALRESTRSFQPLMRSSTFWASRFQPGLDRGMIFENLSRPEVRDWLSLYRRTSQRRSPAGLKNRIRIWNLISHIVVLLELRLSDDVDCGCNLTDDTSKLIEANGSLMELVRSQFGGL